MKKHIEKKCLTQVDAGQPAVDIIKERGFDIEQHLKPKDVPKNFSAVTITEDGKVSMSFQFNDNGRIVFIPEPDPVLIFFDSGYHHFKHLTESRVTLLQHFKGIKLDENYLTALYAYYGHVNGFIILLFTSLEAFINHNIPEEHKHIIETTKRTEVYNKTQIIQLTFKDKLNILKDISEKDFAKNFPLKYDCIIKLKEFRDNIVHLKPEKGNNTPYAYLYKHGLNFRFEETIDAVMDFMNFYKQDFVTYCPCSNDF